jgi:hypothetical protein
MRIPFALAALALLASQACHAEADFSGQVRAQWTQVDANAQGPLALADALQPGTAALPASGAVVETELRSSAKGFSAIATFQQQRLEDQAFASHAWFNELYYAHDAGGWQFSVGKRIVAWDVGYAFRPNDFVQQEERRMLVTSTPQGRPVLMAEHFDADTAWSLVWANPTADSDARGAQEPALAARVYRRDGALDWHGFARLGARTGASVGAALAWVATESTELHASARLLQRADSKAYQGAASGLNSSDPWLAATVQHPQQALLGGTWTNADQLSLLVEAWWDGTALSDSQWTAWRQRNAALPGLAAHAPPAAVAGNLAWQADAFGASSSLRRGNIYARLSWQHDKWTPTLDVLYTPVDGGRVVTAALAWQGDRLLLQGGVRSYGGAADALYAQLPTRQTAYLNATWSF